MEIDLSKGVHESGWVKFRGFFNPTHHGGLKKIQPNPYGLGWIGLDLLSMPSLD